MSRTLGSRMLALYIQRPEKNACVAGAWTTKAEMEGMRGVGGKYRGGKRSDVYLDKFC